MEPVSSSRAERRSQKDARTIKQQRNYVPEDSEFRKSHLLPLAFCNFGENGVDKWLFAQDSAVSTLIGSDLKAIAQLADTETFSLSPLLIFKAVLDKPAIFPSGGFWRIGK